MQLTKQGWLYIFAFVLCYSSNKIGLQAQKPEGQFHDIYWAAHDLESVKKVHKPLCHALQKEVELKDEYYEYMPSSYVEYICSNPKESKIITKDSPMCTFPGFECVQKRKEMTIAKRKKGSEVWEFYTQLIASDCDCMLPVLQLPSGNSNE